MDVCPRRNTLAAVTIFIVPTSLNKRCDTLLNRCEYLQTVPLTIEPSRHTSRGQRLSPPTARRSLNSRTQPARLDLVK